MKKISLTLLLLAALLAVLISGCSNSAVPDLGQSGQATLVFVYTDN